MGRISKTEKLEYLIVGDEEQCYFCGGPPVMWDLTPNNNAAQYLLDNYEGQKVRVKCCDNCWRRIYTANVAKGGVQYGVQRGMMTLEQKRNLLSTKVAADALTAQSKALTICSDPKMVMPSSMLIMDDGKYLWDDTVVYLDEMMYLQGAMSIRMVGLPETIIEAAVLSGLNSGELDPTRIPIYRKMLGLAVTDEQPESTD
jgi:hypothetical protein